MISKLQNARQFLRCISFHRGVNMIKVYLSYYLTILLKRPIQWGQPFSISIEPTTACNLRCPECPSGLRQFTRDTGNLKMDFFSKMILEMSDKLTYLSFYFQGEPYINPDFLKMVRFAKSHKIYTSTSTNGHFLSEKNVIETIESGLDRLIISIDGTTQEVYEQYRISGDLQTVLEGTKRLIEWKHKLGSTTPFITFQFLVVKPNEHQIEDVKRLTRELGVDELKLKTAQIYNYQNGSDLIPENTKYARYKKNKDGSYSIKNPLYNRCWKLWHSCMITWDGKVVPCCFDKDASFVLGDLQKETFSEVWSGKKYIKFREQILHSRKQISICKNCTEGCKVWA